MSRRLIKLFGDRGTPAGLLRDIIISGGEKISSIEVEQTIAAHPAALECAVIGIPYRHRGERPKAIQAGAPSRKTQAIGLTGTPPQFRRR